MKATILKKLDALAKDNAIKILYACESGSRAWGFPSPDSDYDVRFIYVYAKDRYLSVDEPSDVMQFPIDATLDIGGWELRKTLRLLKKSNATIFEWLQSPIVYAADANFVDRMNVVLPQYFSPRAGMHHYLSMTRGIFNNDIQGETVRLKKYLYALRTLLASKWIAERGTMPPMAFDALSLQLGDAIKEIAQAMILKKSTVDETFTMEKVESLHALIARELAACEAMVPEASGRIDNDALNVIFKEFAI
ncbi:nucleotidyltransferase domain-containing protein [Chryseolinea lacunae]|uniref:Nucleotidyltransferase domain-containing protein n=1 Tax=Chryseolinea lacunae TaxID=2801331 RepID=A0ABS1KR94_9BACT|nr:nucleotidyltransferase domain-containing protein [Chryseolinea lacunae]MBL0741989.1 nucleotidyltransferase domain-containing protein [Chryseolinea lacunae]